MQILFCANFIKEILLYIFFFIKILLYIKSIMQIALYKFNYIKNFVYLFILALFIKPKSYFKYFIVLLIIH